MASVEEAPAVRTMRREYELYDRNVDIVSAFHWFFTATREMPSVVRHFDRYPRLPFEDDRGARTLTPDFTVLFTDGSAWVAEIANIAQREESVDKLCVQLDNYSRLTSVRDADGSLVEVSGIDVIFLSPINTGADAARRVFSERLDNSDHSFKPLTRPTFIQFAQQPDEYVFQPWPDQRLNGALRPHGDSELTAMRFNNLNVRPHYFANNKVQYAFCNDQIPPLYLATRLLLNVFPSLQRDWRQAEDVSTEDIVHALQVQYGHGVTSDVARAMALLRQAGFVSQQGDRGWRILRAGRAVKKENLTSLIATRAVSSQGPRSSRRPSAQPTALFDDFADLDKLPAAGEAVAQNEGSWGD